MKIGIGINVNVDVKSTLRAKKIIVRIVGQVFMRIVNN